MILLVINLIYMETNEEKIKKIFSDKFDVRQNPLELSDFDKIQIEVAQKKFFKFSGATFNIYYALAIVSTFALSIGMGIDYIIQRKHINDKIMQLDASKAEYQKRAMLNVNESIEVIKTSPDTKVSAEAPKTIDKGKSFPKPKNEQSAKKILNSTNLSQHKDNMIITPILPEIIQQNKPKPVLIIKQDTIIRYDSVRVKKRKSSF